MEVPPQDPLQPQRIHACSIRTAGAKKIIVTLEPNQTLEIRFAHGRDSHGEPLVTDGSITVKFDNENKRIRIEASEPDSVGRVGVVYEESFGHPLAEAMTEKDLQLFNKIQEIVSTPLGHDCIDIYQSSDFIHDLGADSLDIVELAMAFEHEFGIEIPDEAVESMATVGDVLACVGNKT